MRGFYLLVLVCLSPCVLRAQDSEAQPKPILSPDKNWEYRVVDADTAVLVKAGDDKPAVTLSGPDDDGTPLKTKTGYAGVAAFQADPEWQKVKAESEAHGPLVDHIDRYFMEPTSFSALH
jgi:hypothetical protein